MPKGATFLLVVAILGIVTARADWSSSFKDAAAKAKDKLQDQAGKAAKKFYNEAGKTAETLSQAYEHSDLMATAAHGAGLAARTLSQAYEASEYVATTAAQGAGMAAETVSWIYEAGVNEFGEAASMLFNFEMRDKITCSNDGRCSGSFFLGPKGCGDKCIVPIESQVGAKGNGLSTQIILKFGVGGTNLIDRSLSLAQLGGSSTKVRAGAVAKLRIDPICATVPTLVLGNGKACFRASNLVYSESRGLSLDYEIYVVVPFVELELTVFKKTFLRLASGGVDGGAAAAPCGAHRNPEACVADVGCGWCSTGKGLCLPLPSDGGEDKDELALCSTCAFFSSRIFRGKIEDGKNLSEACLRKPGCGACTSFGHIECHEGDEFGFRGTRDECAGRWQAPKAPNSFLSALYATFRAVLMCSAAAAVIFFFIAVK